MRGGTTRGWKGGKNEGKGLREGKKKRGERMSTKNEREESEWEG